MLRAACRGLSNAVSQRPSYQGLRALQVMYKYTTVKITVDKSGRKASEGVWGTRTRVAAACRDETGSVSLTPYCIGLSANWF